MAQKELKRVEGKKFFNYKRRFGDRNDGWRVRSNDPFFGVIPHIMKTRLDSMVFFEDNIEVDVLESFVRKLRRETEMTDLSALMVVMTACLRAMSMYPKVNRFVCGRKVFARNYLSISLVIKKELSTKGEECTVTPRFDPDATIYDVWKIMHQEIISNKGENTDNATVAFAKIINAVPNFMIRIIVGLVKLLDNWGFLPQKLIEILPFHTSFFITDIGSVGINSVYHHLYEFGTCSVFLSVGKKEKKLVLNGDGTVSEKKFINYRFVIDERIADGYYYARVMKAFRKLMKNPEVLLEKPETVIEDDLK